MSAVQNNYLSDAEILAWVEAQQNELYGDLRDSMAFAQKRTDMAGAVADVKLLLAEAAKDPKKLIDLDAALKDFRATYEGTPEFEEVLESMGTVEAGIKEAVAFQKQAATLAAPPQTLGGSGRSGWASMQVPSVPTVAPAAPLDPDTVKIWTENLDKKVDGSNQNQQTAMIHIGEIKSNIDQAGNLASQLLKSHNDAASFIINNYA